MKKCFIHFGMHKTGSTSIQLSLHKGLRSSKFHYICLDNSSNQSVAVTTMFRKNPELYYVYKRLGLSTEEVLAKKNKMFRNLESEILIAGGKDLILSAEDIEYFGRDALTRLKYYLLERGFQPIAVAYVREPKTFMESAFQQKLKWGAASMNLNDLFPRYPERFKKFYRVFGNENVKFWKFEPSQFIAGDVVIDFCNRLGIDFISTESIKVNESFSLPAVQLLYCFRIFGPYHSYGSNAVRENRLLLLALGRLGGNKLRFHSSLVIPVIKKNRQKVDWMSDQLGEMLKTDLFQDDDIAIQSEVDLLCPGAEAIQWLAAQLGSEYDDIWRTQISPQRVADMMQALQDKLGMVS